MIQKHAKDVFAKRSVFFSALEYAILNHFSTSLYFAFLTITALSSSVIHDPESQSLLQKKTFLFIYLFLLLGNHGENRNMCALNISMSIRLYIISFLDVNIKTLYSDNKLGKVTVFLFVEEKKNGTLQMHISLPTTGYMKFS